MQFAQNRTVEIDIANSALDRPSSSFSSSSGTPPGIIGKTYATPSKEANGRAGTGSPIGTDEPTATLTLTSSFVGSTVNCSTSVASPMAAGSPPTHSFSGEEKKDEECADNHDDNEQRNGQEAAADTGKSAHASSPDRAYANEHNQDANSTSASDDDDSMDGFLPLRKYDSLDTVMMGQGIPSPIVSAPPGTAAGSYHSGAQPVVKSVGGPGTDGREQAPHPALLGSLTPPNPGVRVNFSPGPTGLPKVVMEQVAQSLVSSVTGEGGDGMLSAMFLSHRSPEFTDPNTGILAQAVTSLRTVMSIPDGDGDRGYEILFLHGGGHGQFASVPLNLCASRDDKGTYLVSGTWSARAIGEAAKYCTPDVLSSITDDGRYLTFPEVDFNDPTQVDPNSKFVYMCTNETVNGVEVFHLPTGEDRSPVPLVLDASSDFTTKPIEWTDANVGILFACASKNIGHPGLTAVVIRRDLLDPDQYPSNPTCPGVFHYATQAKAGNLWNTTATFNVQVVGMMMDWILANGGVDEMERLSKAKAALIYDLVDASDGFYEVPPVDAQCRSRMNVPFAVRGNGGGHDEDVTERFLIEAWEEGIVGLRTITPFGVGDYLRASLYHGVSWEDTVRLVDFMDNFMKINGRRRL